MFDPQNLPLSGGLILAAAAYAAISFFATGPLIAERAIAKSGWAEACPAALNVNAARQVTPTPQQNCQAIVGMVAREFAPFCDLLNVVPQAGTSSPSQTVSLQTRCSCAASVTLERRTAWALYAGSARLVTPPAIKNLDATLAQALNTLPCAFHEGGAS